MSFRIQSKRSLEKNLRRMVESQVEKASEALRGKTELTVPEVVHDVRKRFKRIRALARLSRKALGNGVANDLNRRFRDAARPLSELRDAEVLVQTLDDLAGRWAPPDRPEGLSAVRELLENRLEATRRRDIREEDRFSSVLDAVEKALREFKRSEFAREDWGALADGLTRNYDKCFAALKKAKDQPNDVNLHTWRKRIKDLLYETRILRPVRPLYFQRFERQAGALADLLGEDHDLAVLRGFLTESRDDSFSLGSIEAAISALDARRQLLQGSAFSQGASMLDECVDVFGERIDAYFTAWRAEIKAAALDRSLFESRE